MTSMKRFGLAALFAIGAALFTSSPALAEDFGPITLSSTTNVRDQDYGATGQATLTGNVSGRAYVYDGYHRNYLDIFNGELTVAYQGLTPGATYRIGTSVWIFEWRNVNKKFEDDYYSHFTASASGTGEVTFPVSFVAGGWSWIESIIGGGYYGYWEYWGPRGYSFSVARKQGSKYIGVLGGHFPPPDYVSDYPW